MYGISNISKDIYKTLVFLIPLLSKKYASDICDTVFHFESGERTQESGFGK